MLSNKQIEFIRQYVSDKYFNQEKLISYLCLHDVVGVEIFQYVERTTNEKGYMSIIPAGLTGDNSSGYIPLPVDKFVRRIPFYFYMRPEMIVENDKYQKSIWQPLAISDVLCCIGENPFSKFLYYRETPLDLEAAFEKLEYLFYEKQYSLLDIFNYPGDVTNTSIEAPFGDWFDYIDMCIELGWDNLMPERLYTKYNEARIALGKKPVIFLIEEFNPDDWKENRSKVEFYRRKGNRIELYGRFPCDENGKPVLEWVAINIEAAENISCDCAGSSEGHLIIDISPQTVIHIQIIPRDELGNPLEEGIPEWKQIYAGPQTMDFNYRVLKQRRKELGYTQQQVADAVETNVRTYQKWENGETKPDGYFLLRILNWLDIPNINDVIIYNNLT